MALGGRREKQIIHIIDVCMSLPGLWGTHQSQRGRTAAGNGTKLPSTLEPPPPSPALLAVPLLHFMGEDEPAAVPSSRSAIGRPAGRPSFDKLLRRGGGNTPRVVEVGASQPDTP